MKAVTLHIEVPEDIEKRLLDAGLVVWGAVGPKPDSEHLADFASTLELTRQHFGTEGDAELHGLYLDGTDIVLGHTGVSPNSPLHARILVGLWNALHGELSKDSGEDGGTDAHP